MGLSDIVDFFFPEPTIADTVPYVREYTPEIEDEPIFVATGETVKVESIGNPYGDGERYYVVGGVTGDTWATWATLDELF